MTIQFKSAKDLTAEEWKAGVESGKKKLAEARKIFGSPDEASAQAVPPVANPQLTWAKSMEGTDYVLRSNYRETGFSPTLEIHFKVEYYYDNFVLLTGRYPRGKPNSDDTDILNSPADAKTVAELNLKRYQDMFIADTKRAKGLWNTELATYDS